MNASFSIHFSDHGIVFRHLRAGGCWMEIGRIDRDAPWDSAVLDVIRGRAERLGCGQIATVLTVDTDLVSYTHLTALDRSEDQTTALIREHIAIITGQDAEDFAIAWTEDVHLLRIVYAELAELTKLERFVTMFGFPVIGFAAIQDERDDFPSCIMLGLSDFGRSRHVSAAAVRDSLLLPGQGGNAVTNSDRDSPVSDSTVSHMAASRRASSIAALCQAALLTIAAAAFNPSPAFATGGDSEQPETGTLESRAVAPGADSGLSDPGADTYGVTVITGWQSAIAAEPAAPPLPVRYLADRGFDPADLDYNLLKLAALTLPEGHDLLPTVPDFTLAHQPENRDPQATLTGRESPLRGTGQVSVTGQSRTPDQDNSADIDSPSGQDSRESAWRPLPFSRPVLRDGARHRAKVLPFPRPVLRTGAREQASGTAEEKPDQAAAEDLLRTAILESLEPAEEPVNTILIRPERRPQAPVAVPDTASEAQPTIPVRLPRNPAQGVAADAPPRASTRPSAAGAQRTHSAATIDTQLDLTKINLIGIHGDPEFLRALIRLPGGRFTNLYVGADFQGGTVVEITNSSVTYITNGEARRLTMPN